METESVEGVFRILLEHYYKVKEHVFQTGLEKKTVVGNESREQVDDLSPQEHNETSFKNLTHPYKSLTFLMVVILL